MSEPVYTDEQTKEHRRIWVKALRSGEYQQGHFGLLTDDGGYCCLGVACDLFDKAGVNPDMKWERKDGVNYFVDRAGRPPKEVMEWLGLRDRAGAYDTGSLAALNDNGAVFSQIADVIESEPDELLGKFEDYAYFSGPDLISGPEL